MSSKIIDGVSYGGSKDVYSQMEGLSKSLQRRNSQTQPTPLLLSKRNLLQEKEKGVSYGGLLDAVRQMDELTRLINKKNK